MTPPFPEYPSTHAATGAAAASALALELGNRATFTVTNPKGVSRTYKRFSAAAYEEGISRIYCGIHFRTATNMGFATGGLIARHVDKTLLQAVDERSGAEDPPRPPRPLAHALARDPHWTGARSPRDARPIKATTPR